VELENKLETRIIEVNQRIESGDNEHLKIKKRGLSSHWTLPYVSDPESTNHSFFGALKQIDIGSVLHYVNQHCQFIDTFEHVLGLCKADQGRSHYCCVSDCLWHQYGTR